MDDDLAGASPVDVSVGRLVTKREDDGTEETCKPR